jgi:anti-anti-sigma factor
MQITQHPGADSLELRLTGRIDATWAELVGKTIEDAIRAGSHHLTLNFAGVDYISSLGIRVLILQYKQLKAVKGSLLITHPSEMVRDTLITVGLASLIGDDKPSSATAAPAAPPRETRGGAVYEVYPQPAAQPLTCILTGDPALLATSGFTAADSRSISFPSGAFGLGLGAFGSGFDDCQSRFGEFLAAGGAALALPTNEPDAVPDYVIEEGGLIPRVETLYALTGSGSFSTMVRFDSAQDGPGKIPLSELVSNLLDIASSSAIAFVVLAEAAGIVGATLRRSPALKPLSHGVPAVRDWLSFTTERVSEKSLALIVGVAGRTIPVEAQPFLRPLRKGSDLHAHIHAAVFPYHPVQRGELAFNGTVPDLLSASSPSAILHLMADSRPYEGVGETDLARGACWLSPLQSIARG